MQLTPNFTLEEFTVSETAARRGILNVPPLGSPERANLERLAQTMEAARAFLEHRPILITSGYRSAPLNRMVGGSKTSQHMHGLACDFICPLFGTPLQVCNAIKPHMKKLAIDQLIYEFETWVHLGLTAGMPRHVALTIDANGTRNGFG